MTCPYIVTHGTTHYCRLDSATAENERLRATILDALNAFDVYREDDDNEPFDQAMETMRSVIRAVLTPGVSQ